MADFIPELKFLSSLSSPVSILKNGDAIKSRPRINLVEGSGISITESDNPTDYSTDITISSSGITAPVDYIQFNTTPTYTPATGMIHWGPTGTLEVEMGNITQQVGEEFFRYGKASTAISDTNLQLVYKTGVVGASGVITFAPAVAGITDPDQIIGIATEPIALNGFGRVTTMGVVHGINTTGSAYGETWANNDDIWYNPTTGGLTKTKPSAPNIKLMVGTVINAGSGGSGSFSVKLGSSSQLGGTDSNVQLGTLANGDFLVYNSTTTRWENLSGPSSTLFFNVKNYGAKGDGSTNDFTAINNASTAASAVGGILVFPYGTYRIASTMTISANCRFHGGKLLVPSGVVVTMDGSIEAPLTQIFTWTGTGDYILGKAVKKCPVHWFGAKNDTSDSSAAINKCITCCDYNQVVVWFSGVMYGGDILVASSLSPERACIDSESGSELIKYTGKTNGFNIRKIQYSNLKLPKISSFTAGSGILVQDTRVCRITSDIIGGCANGITIQDDATYTATLDNVFTVTEIATCTEAAVKVSAAHSSVAIQGNEFHINFILNCKRGLYFVDSFSATSVDWDSNKFICQAIDANTIDTAYGIHNSSNAYVSRWIIAVETWFGGFNTGTPHYADGRFDGCEFRLGWAENPASYAAFSVTPQGGAGAAGNRYISLGGSMQWGSGIAAATASNSRATFNSGNVISLLPNKFLVKCTTSVSTASDGVANFYVYHPYADGKAVITTSMADSGGFVVANCGDTSSSYANEIWLQLQNVTSSSIAARDTYVWVTIGQ